MNKVERLTSKLCPQGVPHHQITEVFEIRNGYTPSKAKEEYWNNGTIPWIRLEDIRTFGRVLDRATQYIHESGVRPSGVFQANSIIISTLATIGEHALVTVPFTANQQITILTINEKFTENLDPKFAFYYCFNLAEYCRAHTSTSGFASVNMRDFKKFSFPLPPLEVQLEVVRILDTFTELEAQLEAELEARVQQFAHYTSKIFEDQKYNFELKKLGEIARCYAGATPLTTKSEYWDGGTIPWIASGEVNKGTIYAADAYITEKGYESSSTKMVPSGSVLIALAGQGKTRGMVARTRLEACTNQSLCAIVPVQDVDPDYLFFYMRTQYQNYRSMSSGEGGRGGLNLQIIKSIEIPVPSLQNQFEIVKILEKFEELTQGVTSSLPAEISARRQQYEHYRSKLLNFEVLGAE